MPFVFSKQPVTESHLIHFCTFYAEDQSNKLLKLKNQSRQESNTLCAHNTQFHWVQTNLNLGFHSLSTTGVFFICITKRLAHRVCDCFMDGLSPLMQDCFVNSSVLGEPTILAISLLSWTLYGDCVSLAIFGRYVPPWKTSFFFVELENKLHKQKLWTHTCTCPDVYMWNIILH